MVTRARNFVVVSLSVLAAGIGAGLVAYAGFPTSAFSQQERMDELQFVPRDAGLIAFASVSDLMASDLGPRIRRILPLSEPAQREMESQTGINIETDIDFILACAMPAATGAETNSTGLMLLRGRFDESKVQGALQKNGASLVSYGGTRVVIVERPEAPAKPNAEPSEALGVAFLEPGLMAVGSVDLVRAAIDLKRGGSSVTSNAEMMEHVRSLDAGNVWAVGRLDALAPNGRLPLAFADQFPSITWFTLTGNVDAGMRGMLKAETRDEEAATRLRDVVRGLITVFKVQASASRPEMRAVLDSLELGGTGTTVALSFQLPAVVLDRVTSDGGDLRGP